jgi:uncharacterized DUF497 family protein
MIVIEFNHNKELINLAKHGISLTRAEEFDWDSAIIRKDNRMDYGEPRYRALGFIGERLHALIFTHRSGNLRIISLRKANDREKKIHEKR